MRIYRVGEWALPVGVALTGAGALFTAMKELKILGFVCLVLGGSILLIGFILQSLGLRAHFADEVNRQENVEARERERDARDRERDARDIERLDIERKHLLLREDQDRAKNEVRTATSPEQLAAARASEETALSIQQQALVTERATKEEWLKTAVDYGDSPRTKVLEAELEINRLRMTSVERDLEALKASIPDKEQRQREVQEGIRRISQLGA